MAVIANCDKQLPAIVPESNLATAGQYLTFVLGSEVYALGILNIKKIIDYDDLTEVPMMPAFVRGVINLRGSVVPVIDLMARFGKGSTAVSKRTGIVIVETGGQGDGNQQDIGIIVDAVNEVIDIGPQDIEPPPSFGTDIHSDFISGMAKRNWRFIILLNVNKVLSADEMAGLSTASDVQVALESG
ncbi:Positive regulator of CheA protein activity (CheW) [Methylomonas albis]|uniref:Chemotaxis protein CheW n=1 Tax=Methylomonas albis TaxID=1854563 RepID=A0ABR9D118_9GAMM|nr:chemotaxis protein CheW [Methylomonas albis]MBD9356496.1 chemotaxis protein CheW [Methylomonas albis]CAD6879605.1 Positive regulator of CheA protein activity (CheW) [Methylomonas albis]